jgi:hypothetical protein
MAWKEHFLNPANQVRHDSGGAGSNLLHGLHAAKGIVIFKKAKSSTFSSKKQIDSER